MERVYACLDGRTFDELIPTSEERPPAKRRVKEQQTDLNVIRHRRSSLASAFIALLHQHDARISTIAIDTVEDTVSIGVTASQNTDTAPNQNGDNAEPSNSQHIDQPAIPPKEEETHPIPPVQPALQSDDDEAPTSSRASYIEIMRRKREQRRNLKL